MILMLMGTCLLLNGCSSIKNFVFKSSEIEKIEFYYYELTKEIDGTEKDNFLLDLRKINYKYQYSECKCMSEYYFIVRKSNRYLKFEPYRVNEYDANSKLLRHYKYSCDYQTVFMPLISDYITPIV